MQKKKNIKLLAVLAGLLTITIIVFVNGRDAGGLDIDKRQFTLNPQTEITDVLVKGLSGDIHNEFSFQSGNWYINSKYVLDQNMRDVFFSVLSQMEIRRPISENEADSLINFLKTDGYQVEIYDNSELINAYTIGGNEAEIITYIMDKEEVPYEIHLPGYQSYVAGIFNVPENDWRDRFVFEVNPISLNRIDINFNADEAYSVKYDQNEFAVEGMVVDSLALANYMEEIVLLQTDEYISLETNPQYERLVLENEQFLAITVIDVSGRKQVLTFFQRINDDPYILGILSDGSACLFRFDRIKTILSGPVNF